MKYSRIIFVCTGNTCRSPMAEAVCKDLVSKNSGYAEIISRGLSVYPGDGINPLAEEVLNEIGLTNKEHRAKQLTAPDFDISGASGIPDAADNSGTAGISGAAGISGGAGNSCRGTVVIAMTESHKKVVLRRFPEQRNVFTLKEIAGEHGDVADPFGGNKDIYSFCLLNIAGLISKALKSEVL